MTAMSDDALLPSFDVLAEAALLLVEEAAHSALLAEACQHDVDYVVGMFDSAIASGASRLELEDLAQDLAYMRERTHWQALDAEMWGAVLNRCTLRMNVVRANPQWRN